MAEIYTRAQIEQVIRPAEIIAAMERAFVAYSRSEAVIPPVGQMNFEDPPGDCHIKYGYLKRGSTFTVKIATGFWKNPERGLPSSNGVVLVFSSKTGELLAILQDEGYLTDIRTAAAGAVAAKYLAPSKIGFIGIIGSGTASLQSIRISSFYWTSLEATLLSNAETGIGAGSSTRKALGRHVWTTGSCLERRFANGRPLLR